MERTQNSQSLEARVSRCTRCGGWTWDGRCTSHPEAAHDTYPLQITRTDLAIALEIAATQLEDVNDEEASWYGLPNRAAAAELRGRLHVMSGALWAAGERIGQ